MKRSSSISSRTRSFDLGFGILLAALGIVCPFAYADEGADSYKIPEKKVETGSAASFDKRLPPVIPGEEIQDGDKKIKVWSTSGGVSVSAPPAAPEAPAANNVGRNNAQGLGNIGVVVDGRGVPRVGDK